MDGATLTRPAPERSHPEGPAPLGSGDRPRRLAASAVRLLDAHRIGMAVILLAALGVRLWGIKQGLPYSYIIDEATHFVPKAIAFMSSGNLNPHYFLNPPGYSYLLSIVFELWFGSADAVSRAYATHPTEVFVVARLVAAALGTVSVWLTYLAGARFFNRTVGLLAAAIFGFALMARRRMSAICSSLMVSGGVGGLNSFMSCSCEITSGAVSFPTARRPGITWPVACGNDVCEPGPGGESRPCWRPSGAGLGGGAVHHSHASSFR